MSWLTVDGPGFSDLLAKQAVLADDLGAFYESLWDEELVPHRLLEICRLRIARIHDCAPEWARRDNTAALTSDESDALHRGLPTPFDDAEQSALVVAEKLPYDVHGVTDEDVARLSGHLGNAGAVKLLTAIALFDATCRMKNVLGVDVVSPGAGRLG